MLKCFLVGFATLIGLMLFGNGIVALDRLYPGVLYWVAIGVSATILSIFIGAVVLAIFERM